MLRISLCCPRMQHSCMREAKSRAHASAPVAGPEREVPQGNVVERLWTLHDIEVGQDLYKTSARAPSCSSPDSRGQRMKPSIQWRNAVSSKSSALGGRSGGCRPTDRAPDRDLGRTAAPPP